MTRSGLLPPPLRVQPNPLDPNGFFFFTPAASRVWRAGKQITFPRPPCLVGLHGRARFGGGPVSERGAGGGRGACVVGAATRVAGSGWPLALSCGALAPPRYKRRAGATRARRLDGSCVLCCPPDGCARG